jgi:hypothetical protein
LLWLILSVKIVSDLVPRKSTIEFKISKSVNSILGTNFELTVITHAEETNSCTMTEQNV